MNIVAVMVGYATYTVFWMAFQTQAPITWNI